MDTGCCLNTECGNDAGGEHEFDARNRAATPLVSGWVGSSPFPAIYCRTLRSCLGYRLVALGTLCLLPGSRPRLGDYPAVALLRFRGRVPFLFGPGSISKIGSVEPNRSDSRRFAPQSRESKTAPILAHSWLSTGTRTAGACSRGV